MKRARIVVVLVLLGAALGACVAAADRLLDEKSAVADPYFAGRFAFSGDRVITTYLKDKKFLIEEKGELIGFATLHKFSDDLLIAQSWNVKRGGGDPPYLFFLLRKTPTGFDLGGEAVREKVRCGVDGLPALFTELDVQKKTFLANPRARVPFERR